MPDFRAALGRGGDRMMGHLTPGEAVIPRGAMTPKLYSAFNEALSRQGMMPEQYIVGSGYNSINPMTGQPEFQGLSFSGRESRSQFDNDPNFGGNVDFSQPSRSSRTGGVGRESGDRAGGLSFTGGPRQTVTYTNDPNFGGIVDFSPPATTRPTTPGPESETDSIVQDAIDALTPSEAGLGFLGVVNPLVGGLAKLGARYGGGLSPEGRARLDRLAAMRRDPDQMQGMSRAREMRELSFTRPAAQPTPQFLGLTSAMSPLQMRSAIASRAVAGQAGEYISPEAATFYDNLLQRALISDTGELFGLDTLLPIDLQYLAQIRGIENPADTRGLLAALGQ